MFPIVSLPIIAAGDQTIKPFRTNVMALEVML